MEAGIVTIPPTTTGTAGSNVVAAYVAHLEWELGQDAIDGSSRTTFPAHKLRVIMNDYRAQQRELAASREREARLRECVEWYADPDQYRMQPCGDLHCRYPVDVDSGRRARAALASAGDAWREGNAE